MRSPFYKSHHFLLSAEKIRYAGSPNGPFEVSTITGYDAQLADTFKISKKDMQGRIGAGDKCFAVSDGTGFLGVLWAHTGECFIRGAGKRIQMGNDEVYLYGIFTKPEARRRNVFRSLLNACLRHYSEQNIKKYYALVAVDNLIMQRALEKNGFTVDCSVLYLKAGPIGMLYERGGHGKKFKIISKDPDDCFVI